MSRRIFLAIIGCFPLLVGLLRRSRAKKRPETDWACMTGEHYHDPERKEMCRFCG